ncbi:MAG: DMT family transporter [Bdellovibrionaceae bacterium]|nr:DMT family transporter [Pseudobdellovibrionaceae bacterium]
MISDRTEYRRGIYFAIGTALCWAILSILLKFALTFADSGSVVWVRMSIAGLIFSFFVVKNQPKDLLFLFKAPKFIYVSALALAFNFYAYMKCIDLTTASNAQIMIQMGPLLLAVSGILYFKEIPKPLQWLGLFLATLGFISFYYDQLQISWHKKEIYAQGNFWIVAAAITWAFYSFIQKIYSSKISPQKLLYVVFIIASISLLPLVDFNVFFNLSLFQWLLLLFLGINSWIAYGFLSEALKRAPASHVSLVITLNPLLTIFIIQCLNHWNLLFIPYEPLNWTGYLGTAFVVTGVGLTVVSQKK